MTPDEQTDTLARWLEGPPGADPPADLDPAVVEAVYALRPDLAPPPRVSADDILAAVTTGPLAAPGATAAPTEPAAGGEVVVLASRRRPLWAIGAGAGSLIALAAASLLFVWAPMERLTLSDDARIAASRSEPEPSEPAPAVADAEQEEAVAVADLDPAPDGEPEVAYAKDGAGLGGLGTVGGGVGGGGGSASDGLAGYSTETRGYGSGASATGSRPMAAAPRPRPSPAPAPAMVAAPTDPYAEPTATAVARREPAADPPPPPASLKEAYEDAAIADIDDVDIGYDAGRNGYEGVGTQSISEVDRIQIVRGEAKRPSPSPRSRRATAAPSAGPIEMAEQSAAGDPTVASADERSAEAERAAEPASPSLDTLRAAAVPPELPRSALLARAPTPDDVATNALAATSDRLEAARRAKSKATGPDPESLTRAAQAATWLLDEGHAPDAVETAEYGIGLASAPTPEATWLWVLRGDALRAAGDLEGARRSYTVAIEQNAARTPTRIAPTAAPP